jgi:hypothetical protein
MFLASLMMAPAAEVRHSISQIPPAPQAFLQEDPLDVPLTLISIGLLGIVFLVWITHSLYDWFISGGYYYRKALGLTEREWKSRSMKEETRAVIKRLGVANIRRFAPAYNPKWKTVGLYEIKILAEFFPRLGIEPFIHLAQEYSDRDVTQNILVGLFFIKDRLKTAEDVAPYGHAWNRIIQAAPNHYLDESHGMPFLSWFPDPESMEKGLIEAAGLDPKSRFRPFLDVLKNVVKSIADYRAFARAFAETVPDTYATRYMSINFDWPVGHWRSVEDWRRGLQFAVQICEARARTLGTNGWNSSSSKLDSDDIQKLGPVTVLELERDGGIHGDFMMRSVVPAIMPLIERFGMAPFRQLYDMAPEAFPGLCFAFTRPGVHVDRPEHFLDMNFWRWSVYDARKKLERPHFEMVEEKEYDLYSSVSNMRQSVMTSIQPKKDARRWTRRCV